MTCLQHIAFFLPLHERHLHVVLLTLLLMMFPPTFFRFLIRFKDIESSSNVLTNCCCFFIFKTDQCFFHNLGDVWDGSVVRYCQRYTIEIIAIFGFLKQDFSWDITCLFNFFFYVISCISLFYQFLYKFGELILSSSGCRVWLC